MKCKICGQEINKKAIVCPSCGCKVKKPIYKKWWFWALAILIVAVINSTPKKDDTSTTNTENSPTETETVVKEIVYETVDLQTMFDDLDGNAMKAEKEYQKKHIEFNCKIASFDSDGNYICVEPVNASEWNLTTAMCYIKNDTQKNFLLEKNVGDTITIKGKVKSIGEVLGYSIDINEVY